jgi:uncharacterized membrane protein YhaH (DUF805 family)
MDRFVDGLKQYAVFRGRARRPAYWWFFVIYLLISVVLAVVDAIIGQYDSATGVGLLSGLFGLATLLPAWGLTVRRLHDTDRSGWWLLVTLLPVLGAIVMLVFAASAGTRGDNRYGPDPLTLA